MGRVPPGQTLPGHRSPLPSPPTRAGEGTWAQPGLPSSGCSPVRPPQGRASLCLQEAHEHQGWGLFSWPRGWESPG